MSRTRPVRSTISTHPIRWAAFQCTINPNTGPEEQKRSMINKFFTFLTYPKFPRSIAKPAFGTRYTPAEVEMVILKEFTNKVIEYENGMHGHVYFVWAWRRQVHRNEFQIDLDLLKNVLSDAVSEEAMRAAHIDIKFVPTNVQLYSVNMTESYEKNLEYFNNNFPPRTQHVHTQQFPEQQLAVRSFD